KQRPTVALAVDLAGFEQRSDGAASQMVQRGQGGSRVARSFAFEDRYYQNVFAHFWEALVAGDDSHLFREWWRVGVKPLSYLSSLSEMSAKPSTPRKCLLLWVMSGTPRCSAVAATQASAAAIGRPFRRALSIAPAQYRDRAWDECSTTYLRNRDS